MRNRCNPFNPERRRALRQQKFVEQAGLCFYCRVPMQIIQGDPKPTPADAATIEHKIPMWKRPDLRRDPTNIVLACAACNAEKGRASQPEQPRRGAA